MDFGRMLFNRHRAPRPQDGECSPESVPQINIVEDVIEDTMVGERVENVGSLEFESEHKIDIEELMQE